MTANREVLNAVILAHASRIKIQAKGDSKKIEELILKLDSVMYNFGYREELRAAIIFLQSPLPDNTDINRRNLRIARTDQGWFDQAGQ